mgnify:CR=1 FL=1
MLCCAVLWLCCGDMWWACAGQLGVCRCSQGRPCYPSAYASCGNQQAQRADVMLAAVAKASKLTTKKLGSCTHLV